MGERGLSLHEKSAQLVQLIELDIVSGRLGEGAWLKQVDLEARYDCSRIGVRHALERLVDRGLVRLEPNRGYRVEGLSPERIVQLVQVRGILETAATEMVLGRITPEGLRQLDKLAAVFRETVRSGTVEEQENANITFHRALLAFCPNSELVTQVFAARNRVPLPATRRLNTQAHLERKAEEHFEIVRRLCANDRAGLRCVVHAHVTSHITQQLNCKHS